MVPEGCFFPWSYNKVNNSDNSLDIFNTFLSFKELFSFLKGLQESAFAIDGISYSMIEFLPVKPTIFLENFFNIVFGESKVPEDWCKYNTIPILKNGRDPNKSMNYRPISLSSADRKIFEDLVKKRSEWWAEHFSIFLLVLGTGGV